MPTSINPSTVRPPFGTYSHGLVVDRPGRLLVTSGQLGTGLDDSVPEGVEAQAEMCFSNIAAILAEAGMRFDDVVRINAFVTRREHFAGYMAVRDRYIGDPPPASTLVIVSGFTRPEFLVEVEVTAVTSG